MSGALIALGHLGLKAGEQGELVQAGAYYAESLALHREAGTKEGIVKCLAGLATLAAACDSRNGLHGSSVRPRS